MNNLNNQRNVNHLNRFPLLDRAPPRVPPDPGQRALENRYFIILIGRVIIAWGDGQFPALPGNPAAPSCKLYYGLKKLSRMLGILDYFIGRQISHKS